MDRSREIAEIYAACDEEFGVEFRQEAEALADDLVVGFEVDKPRTPVEGLALMRKAYAEVAAKHKAAPKNAPADSGPRGLSVTDLEDSEEFKPGTLDQVVADVAARRRAGTWRGLVDGDAEL
ncbi:MAG: hypothetical protein JW741_12465 [Sedimentisphaerales bacterium]|nr:hypothetical protein [Sedimentisphaerales bacterium]